MSYNRYLMYETNNSNSKYPDYGVITTIINDKLVNVNMGGEKNAQGQMVILESVMVQNGYIPKLGDWVTISWTSGQPIAVGGNSGSNSSGLSNINNDVKIVAQSDLATGTINADHIRAASIQAIHISANAITAGAISANSITSVAISANAITAGKIAANAVSANNIIAGSITASLISAGTITGDRLSAGTITSAQISAGSITGDRLVAGTITATQISANSITSSLISAGSITGDRLSAGTITATQISANSITSTEMKVGTITAVSGILASGSITTAVIADGTITNAKIGNAEITTAKIASGNITTALIQDASITNAKILNLDAGKITTGYISASLISAGSITGDKIAANTISANNIAANQIDTLQLKAGAVTAIKIAAGAITTDRLAANAITADKIAAGSITAEHISTVGLDAQLINVYDSKSGETLIGSGYLRVGGLDVGVVQSDNLVGNGLFLQSSSMYGYRRDNPSGEALLGSNTYIVGGSQIWKINSSTGAVVNKLDIPARKPVGISLDGSGNYGYVTVQGDDTLVQVDMANFVLTSKKLNMGMGPGLVKYTGDALGDMKHFFVLNTDPMDMSIPDSMMVVDAPPMSVGGDLYIHHQIALGNGPYDFVIDTGNATRVAYITQANQGDVAIINISDSASMNWKVIGTIPISAYGTDNYHGGLKGQYGLGTAVGGDASAAYDSSVSAGYGVGGGMAGMPGMPAMGGMDMSHGGSYSASSGSLKTYTPHGIALSADSDTLYVVDYANGELLVVSKSGSAPYNSLTGRHDTSGNAMPGMGAGMSPAMTVMDGVAMGGGPTTKWVRYRISLGSSPEFIKVVNGKIFITLEADGMLAVLDESTIINAINADRTFYATWDTSMPMKPYPTIPVRKITVGSNPSFMEVSANKIFVSLSAQNQIAVIDTVSETRTSLFSVGPNPKGLTISPDGAYLYVVNNGGSGDFSFVYPSGNYIGDAYIGLEGMVEYQGAEFWTPNRSNWVYGGSGNIKSSSTIEFRINEPFLNEGGYSKFTATGTDYQYAMIEQDIYNAVNYSNGNNLIIAVNEVLLAGSANTYFPRNEWINSPLPTFNIVSGNGSGGVVKTPATPSQYTIYYGTGYNAFVKFSGGVVPSGNWIESNYTAKNNLYFKPHNGSIQVAVENSSSPNFYTSFEIDEFVPKFVTVDNLQTSPFTPTGNGIVDTYTGLEYSLTTNRALGKIIKTSVVPVSTGGVLGGSFVSPFMYGEPSPQLVTDGVQVDKKEGDTTLTPVSPQPSLTLPSGNQYVQIDLGATYMIGSISVAHSYGLDRKYHNTKTEVSVDGVSWTAVYDSGFSGEYSEKPIYHATHGHTHYAKFINFNALPVKYVRDWANGWISGDGLSSGSTSNWTEVKVYGDWQVESNYVYPPNTIGVSANTQIATNGKSIVSTDIKDAYVAFDIPTEFTTWWYVTYIVGPGYGMMKVEMPSMGMSHFLPLDNPYVNKVAHRHIMPFPPSVNIKASGDVKAGKHRAIIRQASGKITLDRLRFEDFQKFATNTLLVPNTVGATFSRQRVIAEQAKWYIGSGNQSTEGAYDIPRKNPDTGQRDYSVPIKYRMRVKSELYPSGGSTERGVAYATSAIFETGKQHTHWRRSEAIDSYAGNRIERWDGNQPHKTGIQDFHLAAGAVRAEKILAGAIMDYHISPYAKIVESKLALNYPTHNHTNKTFLDSMSGFSGNGTSTYVARADHDHDSRYAMIGSGGNIAITGNVTAQSISASSLLISGNGTFTGNVNVSGNITVNGLVDGVDISVLNTSFNNHAGSGGSAHALVISSGSAGFISGPDKSKLDSISANAINSTMADALYGRLDISNLNNTILGKSLEHKATTFIAGNNDWTKLLYGLVGGTIGTNYYYDQTNKGVMFSGTSTWAKVRVRLPVDPESTYFVRAKVTKIDGSGSVYIGADSLDNNYNSIATDLANSYNYFGASSVTIASGSSQYLEGTISGYNTTGSAITTKFDPEAKYFDLVLIGNYQGSGATVWEWIELYKAPNTAYVGANKIWHSGNFIPSQYLTTANASTTYLTTGNAASTYLTITNASSTYLTTANAASTYATTATLTGNYMTSANIMSTLGSYVTTANLTANYYDKSTSDVRYIQATGTITIPGSGNVKIIMKSTDADNINLISSLDSGGVTLSNFGYSGSRWTIDGNEVWHSGNFVPSQYLTTANAASTYLTTANAASTYLTISNASSTYATSATLTGNYLTSANIATSYLSISGGTTKGSLAVSSNAIVLSVYGVDHAYLGFFPRTGSGRKAYMGFGSSGSTVLSITNEDTGDLVLTPGSSGFVKISTNVVWHSGNFNPASYYTTSQTYSATTIDSKIAAAGDIKAGSANVFTNTNTFTNAGQAIKIAPSANVAAGTKILQITDSTTTDLFVVDASGNVTVRGNLNVSGTTVYQTATTTSGNQTIIGVLTVSGNSNLGGTSTDVTTVKGTMVLTSGTVLKQVGVYNEVHRRPLFGIAGDLQFQTDTVGYDSIVVNYAPLGYALPGVATGATRYYRLYAIYSDDITSAQVSGGQVATVRLSGSTVKDLPLASTWGDPNLRRDWYSGYFSDVPSGNITVYAGLLQSGNNLGIRWIEMIAYDVY